VEKKLLVAHYFGLCVAHMGCATIATPLVTIYQWRISICATHRQIMRGAYWLYASLVAFKNFKNSKKIKKSKKTKFFFENHKNRNNVKKLLYFNFLRILSYEEYFESHQTS
jgi:hypothetical protein